MNTYIAAIQHYLFSESMRVLLYRLGVMRRQRKESSSWPSRNTPDEERIFSVVLLFGVFFFSWFLVCLFLFVVVGFIYLFFALTWAIDACANNLFKRGSSESFCLLSRANTLFLSLSLTHTSSQENKCVYTEKKLIKGPSKTGIYTILTDNSL